jgi:translation initiation factor IF-2
MSEEKAIRLSKAIKELNIGLDTAIEFLASKGVAIERGPAAANSKIEASAYALMEAQFRSDKEAKERSQKVTLPKDHKDITIGSAKAEKETKVAAKEDVLPDIFKLKEDAKAQAKKDAKAEEPAPVEPPKAPEPVKAPEPEIAPEPAIEPETAPAPAPEMTEEKEVISAKGKAKIAGVKEVGKLDLESLGKPKKKKEEPKKEEPKIEPEPAPEPVVEVTPEPEAQPEPESTEQETIAKGEPELFRAKAEKLTGPKILGKMEIVPESDRKKKKAEKIAASAPDDDVNTKRKRKRIVKVDVTTPAADRPAAKGIKRGKTAEPKKELTDADIQKEVKETLARLSAGKGKSQASKFRREKRQAISARTEEEMQRAEEESLILKVTEFVTVSEMASMMDVPPTKVIAACMSLGIMATINQRLDAETLTIVAEEFGFTVEFVSAEVSETIIEEEDAPEDLESRPPIVTVMGHVDHGKTSLLDFIRKANVIAGEAGGITQHIGAYSVVLPDGRQITFLDTPGHEAFTAMRARGAKVTDIAIIVIAADDSVMPQTREAISHAQAAGIPMVFAFNKMDKDGANADKIREELAGMNILVEEWGGKFQTQEISAKKGLNIDKLLDKVLLEADLLELKANPDKRAVGTVLESELDKGRGYVSTVLVEAGTLKIGDVLLAGQFAGRVKAMFNERGQNVETAGPSVPVSILGINGAPNAGDRFNVLDDEREARNIATKRQQLQREQGIRAQKHITIEEIGRRIALGEFKQLNLIVKGDVDGSVEALTDSLQKLSTEKIQVSIIHRGVGQISESDILLASASDAIVVGFQVRPSANARKLAEKEAIQIRLYSIIYQAIEEIKLAMEGMLEAKLEERITGTAEIRETFKISKVGTIAGCFVIDGKITRNNQVRVIRDGIVIYTGTLGSLKRFKDDVKEVLKGFECGLNIDRFNDIRVGDLVEAFEEVSVKQTLDS